MKLILSLLFFWLPILSFGNEKGDIVLTNENLGTSFTQEILLFEDADKSHEASAILSMPVDSFLQMGSDNPAVQFTTSRFWLKFTLENQSDLNRFFLETARPITDQVYFYSIENGKVVNRLQNGDDFNYYDKVIHHRKNLFPIQLNKGEKRTYIIAVVSGGEGIILPLKIHDKTAFFEQDYKDQFKNGFYYGLMSIIIVIYFFFYLLLRDRTFLYYILYVFFQGLLQFSLDGYSHHHFFPDNAYMINRFPPFSGAMAIIFMLVYVNYFLNLKELAPKFNKVFSIASGLMIISIVFTFLPGKFHSLSYPMVNSFSLLSIVLAVVSIFYQKVQGKKVDNYFTTAFIVLIAGAVVFILGNFNIIKNSTVSLNALKISSIFEVVILSISMSFKYRQLQQEKQEAQAIALKNLKEKNQIMDESNIRLEKQVIERTSEIEKQRAELAYKNEEILSSIQYAKRIQEAILPSDNQVDRLLKDNFVFYLPKDVVSGDFYFVDQKMNGSIVFAAVDCTGHGVPGAFMSIVGNNFLNQSIAEKNLTTPATILNFLNVGLTQTLKYNTGAAVLRDGMDMALCTLNEERNELDFSGAKNPLYIVTSKPLRPDLKPFLLQENDTHALIAIKGDKHPIGNYSDEALQSFKNHKIFVKKNDLIYIFTDGYADQFGGEKGKKYNYRRFRSLLLENADKQMQTQKDILEKSFYEWKGELEQIDDVLVIGVKI